MAASPISKQMGAEWRIANLRAKPKIDARWLWVGMGTTLAIRLQVNRGKQKNAEPFEDINLRLQKVHYQHLNQERSTLIVMADDDSPVEAPDGDEDNTDQKLGAVEQQIIGELTKAKSGLGITRLELITRRQKKSLLRALDNLVQKGLVSVDQEQNRKVWRVE